MAAYGSNVIPTYSSSNWSTSGSITKSALQLSSSSNGAYGQLYVTQSGITIGNTALITTSGCTGTWYLVIYFFAADNSKQIAFCHIIPATNHTFVVHLPSLAVGNLCARVVHRGTVSGTCGTWTFQYELAADTNTTPSSDDTITAGNSRVFHSLPDGTNKVVQLSNMYYNREVTVATLCISFDPLIVSEYNSVSIYVSAAAVINYATGVTASNTMPVYIRLYFGDRMLSQEVYTIDRPYEEVSIPISATLHASVLEADDLSQNIPLKLTVSRGVAASQSTNTLAVNTQQSFISATGPILLNEHRGELSILNDNLTSYSNGLMSICPVYPSSGSRWPERLYYTTPSLPCEVIYMQKIDERVTSDQSAVWPEVTIRTFGSNIKKVRIVAVTEIKEIATTARTVSQGTSLYYVVLTTSNQLQFRNFDNSTLFTIATGVVDFDTTLCGLYGDPNDQRTSFNALFMHRIVGFTIFYTTGSALYVAGYPKWNKNVTNLNTAPTLSAMQITQIDKGSLGTFTQIAVSALYQVASVWHSDGASTSLGTDCLCWSLQFGLTAHMSTNAIIYARIAIDIPTSNSYSGNPKVDDSNNTPWYQVRSSVPRADHSARVPSAGYTSDNTSVSGTIHLGKMITNPCSLSSASFFATDTACLNPIGNTYTDTWYEFRREYVHSKLSMVFTSLGTNANSHFMPSAPAYVKLVKSASNYQEEHLIDMLPSGDAAYFYFGINNAYSYTGSEYTAFVTHFVKGILPRINYFVGSASTDDAYREAIPSATLSADSTNKRYSLLYTDTGYNAPSIPVQCCVSGERFANPTSTTSNLSFYQYITRGTTGYIGAASITSSYLTAYISEISAHYNTGLRYPMQNDFYYTGWMPIKL